MMTGHYKSVKHFFSEIYVPINLPSIHLIDLHNFLHLPMYSLLQFCRDWFGLALCIHIRKNIPSDADEPMVII